MQESVGQVKTNEDGTFLVALQEPGSYTIVIEKTGYLECTVKNIEVETNQQTVLKDYKIIGGDFVKDGLIQTLDTSALLGHMNEIVESEESENSQYDLNGDGSITMLDVSLFLKNYGATMQEEVWEKK